MFTIVIIFRFISDTKFLEQTLLEESVSQPYLNIEIEAKWPPTRKLYIDNNYGHSAPWSPDHHVLVKALRILPLCGPLSLYNISSDYAEEQGRLDHPFDSSKSDWAADLVGPFDSDQEVDLWQEYMKI